MRKGKTVFRRALLFAGLASLVGGAWNAAASDRAGSARQGDEVPRWSFGVLSDTQWTEADDGRNPGTCAVDIINQVNEQFIEHGVKLVVAVGDLTDAAGPAATDLRAVYAQALYNAGIGFFPLRGNHDSLDPAEFRRVYPQTRTGLQNATPADALAVANPDRAAVPPPPVKGSPFTLGSGFQSPPAMQGLSYSFDFENVRFVLIDQFDGKTNTIQPQLGWISSVLAARPAGSHALVFGHKGLRTPFHPDNLFGTRRWADPEAADAFVETLSNHGVRYYVGGHDHMHDLSQIWARDGDGAKVTQLVCASDSSKFYAPARSLWRRYLPAFLAQALGAPRQVPLAQELFRVGYYIFTVEGTRLTVDYYSAAVNPSLVRGDYVIATTPRLAFSKRQTFGYDLGGREFLVAPGSSYAAVGDTYRGTAARILEGVNGGQEKDGRGRPFSHAVNTGWTPRTCGAASDELHLSGMATSMGSERTDPYVLSLSYRGELAGPGLGTFGLESKDARGRWRNAAELDRDGGGRFVDGPWRAGLARGSYGVDGRSQTAWAVVDYDGDFRVAPFDERVTASRCDAEGRGPDSARPGGRR